MEGSNYKAVNLDMNKATDKKERYNKNQRNERQWEKDEGEEGESNGE